MVKVSRPLPGGGYSLPDTFVDIRTHQIVAGDPSLLVLNDRHGCRRAIIALTKGVKVEFEPTEVPDLTIPDGFQFPAAESGVKH